jgi:Caspase domain
MKRAAVCIGVNRAATMTPLLAAAQGARDFEAWAVDQQCVTALLVDDTKPVTASDVFDAVDRFVAGNFGQLIIYFAGHGILTAPGTEYWLLSRAPINPNEAVNLFRSTEDARNSGIPHVVFVSDACRSSVTGPPLSGVTGSVIFPSRVASQRGEVDVYYATRPGDPAYEVPQAQAAAAYKGIFTDALLQTVGTPALTLLDTLNEGDASIRVITSRTLKGVMEATVPAVAGGISVKMRQIPELRVETALPKYFARVNAGSIDRFRAAPSTQPSAISAALSALRAAHVDGVAHGGAAVPLNLPPGDLGLDAEVTELTSAHGRTHFETFTGFSVNGARPSDAFGSAWNIDPPFSEQGEATIWHLRLSPRNGNRRPGSVLIAFPGGWGIIVAALPGFIGNIVVKNERVTSVSYAPSDLTPTYGGYAMRAQALDAMRAALAVAARNGEFMLPADSAAAVADRIRQDKALDPTLGLFAAYAYAQLGRYDDAYSVFNYMRYGTDPWGSPATAVLFDTQLLASRARAFTAADALVPAVPFAPMLAQGWALVGEHDPLWKPIYADLRPHLIPGLWTTFDSVAVAIGHQALDQGLVL